MSESGLLEKYRGKRLIEDNKFLICPMCGSFMVKGKNPVGEDAWTCWTTTEGKWSHILFIKMPEKPMTAISPIDP